MILKFLQDAISLIRQTEVWKFNIFQFTLYAILFSMNLGCAIEIKEFKITGHTKLLI